MIKWNLVSKHISELCELEKNPRYIRTEDIHHLKTSLDKFGLIDKPIINTDNTIIGGHQRIKVLELTGVKLIECWAPDRELNTKEVEELCIRLNKNVGDWHYEVLANEWNVEDLLEWGFTAKELEISPIEDEAYKEPKEEEKDKNINCPKCGHEFLK